MNEQELRRLVRDAIGRQGQATLPPDIARTPADAPLLHASHGMFTLPPSDAGADGRCLIEPVVMCNHCGYCRSYGH
jgi:hypothetical protein